MSNKQLSFQADEILIAKIKDLAEEETRSTARMIKYLVKLGIEEHARRKLYGSNGTGRILQVYSR